MDWLGKLLELLGDSQVFTSLMQTLIYVAFVVPLTVVAGMGLALLLNWRVRGIAIFRTIFYLPSVVPIVAAAISFKLVFDPNAGLANALLIDLGGTAIGWLSDPYAFYVLLMLVVWGVGGGMVIFLAGLQGIPQDLTDAVGLRSRPGSQFLRHHRAATLTGHLLPGHHRHHLCSADARPTLAAHGC